MELRQLTHFLAILDAGSLTGAAARIGLTQQALSRSLARLEEHLGGHLFEREARGMVPTRLGESIAEHARQVVAESGRLRLAASAELGLERGRLVVGLSPIAATSRLGGQVMRFAIKNPKIRIDVESGIDRDFISSLHRGEIDIALSAQSAAMEDSVLLDQLTEERWGVAGCETNRQLAGARHLADLAGAHWVIGRNTAMLDAQIAESFTTAGLPTPQPGIMTTSVLFLLNGLRHSDCLAILPQSLCEAMGGLQWRDLGGPTWNTPIYLMRRKRAHMDDLLQALLRELGAQTYAKAY